MYVKKLKKEGMDLKLKLTARRKFLSKLEVSYFSHEPHLSVLKK